MARKFLYLVAILIGLVLVGALVYRLFPGDVMRVALEPRVAYAAPAARPSGYDAPDLWLARPGVGREDITLWRPRLAAAEGVEAERFPVEAQRGDATVFFVHPTSYLGRDHWNAPLDDAEANWRAGIFVRGMASAFAGAGEVWAPRYRQAAMGAFLTRDVATANRALDAAYEDVIAAWDAFVAAVPPDQPIILAGHSQGSVHLARLMKDRIAGRPIARRIVAAYIVGWPLSVAHDVPVMGLAPCTAADQPNCLLSWSSYAEPAEPAMVLDVFDATRGFDGQSRRGSRILCVNPLTGTQDSAAPASANLGTVRADTQLDDGELIVGAVPARCDDPAAGGRGFLLIGEAPRVGQFVLPGNNYHVYDIPLFWANVRADAVRRLAAWKAAR